MPKVTVLSPTYQHASFIGDCIRSVLAQTVQDWEMIIVDDGSDDGTADIAESFGDPRIVVVRQVHEGVTGLGRTYAAALARAKSPLVAVLEGDDAWPRRKLEIEIPMFNDPAVVLAYGSAGLMDEKSFVYGRFWHVPRGGIATNDPVGVILPTLVNFNFIVASTVMVRRSALEEIGGFFQPSGISYVDHPTWLRLATVGTFARSSQDLGFWRRYARQVTTRGWFEADPDRDSYMQAIATEAHEVVTAEVFTALAESIRRDPSRQREVIAIARGRVALLDGRWRDAAVLFLRVLQTGELGHRAVATLGLACAGVKTDMEKVIGAMGRHSLPSRRHVASHSELEPRSWTN